MTTIDLSAFLTRYKVTAESPSPFSPSQELDGDLGEVIRLFGGKTFDQGIYRLLGCADVENATLALTQCFPEFAGRITPFAKDWLGRHFALDKARSANGKNLVLMLEVGAGEAMEIPANIQEFHNIELVEYANEALSSSFFEQWKKASGVEQVPYDQCVGYKIPLFLGGSDLVENLELIDGDVYVNVCGQLRSKAKKLPEGQTIRTISFS